MWFSRIHARAFGPIKDQGLPFCKGLNIVHGPNESGKSSWHAAIVAALCGLRRGAGRSKAEREFDERHRPWDAGDDDLWFVQAGVRLDDGRHLEIDRDLADRRTDVRRADLGGRAFLDLPMNDGSPDASMLLGLDRDTFPMTACVRQASIVSDLDDPDSLQEYLARAAAGGAGGTAAGALERLGEYKRAQVGLDRRNSTKPLRAAKNAVGDAEANLETAEEAHREYLDLVSTLQDHRRKIEMRKSEKSRVEAQRDYCTAKQESDRLDAAIREFDEWEGRFGAGDPSVKELPELTELAQALGNVENPPAAATTLLGSVADLKSQLAELDGLQEVPCPELHEVQRCVKPLRSLEVSASGAPDAGTRRGKALVFLWIAPLLVGGLVSILYGTVPGLLVAVAGGSAAACSVLVVQRARVRRARTSSAKTRQETASTVREEAERRLAGWQLPFDPDAAVAQASNRLQALAERSTRREQLRADIERRRRFDSAESDRMQLHERAWATLRDLASEHGVEGFDEEVLRHVRELIDNHSEAQRTRTDDVEEWGRYQQALGGRSSQEWREDASSARDVVNAARRRLGEWGVEPAATGIEEHEREVERIDGLLQDARGEAKKAEGRLTQIDQDSVDVAAAEARLSEAEAELTRVERLADTLDKTRDFLEAAAENAHQLLAPELGIEMTRWIPKVTEGRYKEVQVDPGDLSVTLVTAAGDRRDAQLVSQGTMEQVYLVLRLVLAQVLSAAHEACPVLLDDPTVHADAARKTEILNYLFAASREHQVIVFSQEQEVLDWAKNQPDGAVHLIELDDPQPA